MLETLAGKRSFIMNFSISTTTNILRVISEKKKQTNQSRVDIPIIYEANPCYKVIQMILIRLGHDFYGRLIPGLRADTTDSLKRSKVPPHYSSGNQWSLHVGCSSSAESKINGEILNYKIFTSNA